ncbi:TPA: hypothetical protein U3P42_000165 [Streptococcus agalactiae]|nr:hypothetical protein [Streptococcus agalactiae]HEN0480585.1 hypothetical protein [Streptococcus agalactiae]
MTHVVRVYDHIGGRVLPITRRVRRMTKHIEIKDDWKKAVDHLNDFIEKYSYKKIVVVGYQVVRNPETNGTCTHVLVKVD